MGAFGGPAQATGGQPMPPPMPGGGAPMQGLQGTPGGPGTPPQGGMPMPTPGLMGGGTPMGTPLISQPQGGPNGAPPFAAQNGVYNQPQMGHPQPFPPGAQPSPQQALQTPPPSQMPPSIAGGEQPITQDTMRSALGINPTSNDRGASFEAALAGGLKGINGPGKFASFARGLGGGLQGGLNQDQQNLKNNMTVQQQWHNDMSNDFKNTQLLRQTDANVLWRQNQGSYFQARAANQDPNNPARLIAEVDRQESQMRQQARLTLQAAHPGEAIDPKEEDAMVDAQRKQAYQRRGLDPNQVQNVKERGMVVPQNFSEVPTGGWYVGSDGKPTKKTGKEGTSADSQTNAIPSPFDASKMTDDQFHANVPVGSWYIPRGGGAPLYRTQGPPPTWRGAQNALGSPNLDDQYAAYAANQP